MVVEVNPQTSLYITNNHNWAYIIPTNNENMKYNIILHLRYWAYTIAYVLNTYLLI